MVVDVEAHEDDGVNEALLSALESKVKTQRLIAAAEHSCKRKFIQYLVERTRRLTNYNQIK